MKNIFKKYLEKQDKVVIKAALWTPLNSYRFLFIFGFLALQHFHIGRKKIGNIIRYKKAIKNSQRNIVFLFNCFLNRGYDWIFPCLFAENPRKYWKYVCIDGKEYVKQLMDKDTGVILISGHFGPILQTLLFKEVFGISLSTFASAEVKKRIFNSSAKIDKIKSSFPYYVVGEEKQFQEGLLRKEWINFLNDVPVKKRSSDNPNLFGKDVYLSELPFKVSLKYNIPILFVGMTRIKRQYHVSILPISEFSTQREGLEKYVALLEKLLSRDPYAGTFIAEVHF